MIIIVTTMFLLTPVLLTLYLYVSGVFTNRIAFQVSFYFLLVFFALTIGISVRYSYQSYAPLATTPGFAD